MNKSFDIFLSHNSRDKPAVRELAEALRARGLKVWLDEWELVPGRPWQEALEEVIETTRSAAVLVGKDGLGPWQDAEMRSCLSEFVDRKLPVIPVLLPSPLEVEVPLPLFLKRFKWVDLRGGLTEEGINQLQWGATGKRPPASAEVISAPLEIVTPAVVAKERLGQQVRTPWGWLTWIGLLILLGVTVFFISHYFPKPAEPRAQWTPATVSAVRVGEMGDTDREMVENFIPPWISWLIFALTPFATLISSRTMISGPFARLALGIAITVSAVVVVSTGPLAQSLVEITVCYLERRLGYSDFSLTSTGRQG